FRDWTEPFLLLGQIENQLRDLVRRSFTLEQLRAAKNPSDESREITDADDLTFGEYVCLLEPTAARRNWREAYHLDTVIKSREWRLDVEDRWSDGWNAEGGDVI